MGCRWIAGFVLLVIVASVARGQKLIPEPSGSKGYRVNVVSALEKVFREDDFAPGVSGIAQLAAARNEYVSFQLVVEAPWREVSVRDVRFADLAGPVGKIPATVIRWNRVEYVRTTVDPPYKTDRGAGWYPDPLMPAGPFTVATHSRVPIWVTLKTPKNCSAGHYKGQVDVIVDGHEPASIPIALTVWNFSLGDQSHLRTMTWLSSQEIRAFYGMDASPHGREQTARAMENFERTLLEHRLGPGGDIASQVPQRPDGSYDFTGVDATLSRLIDGGMNAFIIGTAPNLRRLGQKEYSAQFVSKFPEMIHAYMDHLERKGWSDLAYVYTYDEAPAAAWDQVKRISAAVKRASPQARIFQCLNQPEGVAALTGSVDVFDVYVAQYHRAGVAEAQRHGANVWLALCCYPMAHPNFFIEYPLVDVRATPWICWKYHAQGFEYWSPNSWGPNAAVHGEKWPKAPWVCNAFNHYNGDGYLLYPGEKSQPYSSIRLEALRDGLQDYEYLWTLDQLVRRAASQRGADAKLSAARRLLSLDGMVSDSGGYATDPRAFQLYREQVASAITGLADLN
jgi:hypothetical protein